VSTGDLASSVAASLGRALLCLYPSDFRREVGEQVILDLRLRSDERIRERGALRWVMWLCEAGLSLAFNAFGAWRERGCSRSRFQSASPLEVVARDVAYAVRQLLGAPVLTVTAALSIAVAIFVAAGAFSALNSILFKPLPVPEAAQIHHVYTSDAFGRREPYGTSSYRDYLDFAESDAFDELAAVSRGRTVSLSVGGASSEGWVNLVSPNYFEMLRMPLRLGRAPEDREPGIVLTYRYWQRAFSADPAALGKLLRVNGTDLVVTGVAPEAFVGTTFGAPAAGWVHAWLAPTLLTDPDVLETRSTRMWDLVGRLGPAVFPEIAAARLNGVAESLEAAHPEAWRDLAGERRLVSVLSDRESRAPPDAAEELIVLTAAGTALIVLLLVVICANVASLLLARAIARRREIAVRVSLGATRARLVSQMLTESLVLALLGTSLGGLGLVWAASVAQRHPMLGSFDLRPDGRVLAVTIALAVTSALLFGSAPVLHSLRTDVRSALGSGSTSLGRSRLRGALIGGQIAVACLLILAAASVAKAVQRRTTVDPGVSTDALVVVQVSRSASSVDAADAELARQVQELIESTPGVRGVASTTLLPLGNIRTGLRIRLPSAGEQLVERSTVSPDYFATVGVGLLEGRFLEPGDQTTEASVVVVNRAFRNAFPSVGPGSLVELDVPEPFRTTEGAAREVFSRSTSMTTTRLQIVGVVEDVLYHSSGEPATPLLYQVGPETFSVRTQSLVVSVSPGAAALVASELRGRMRDRFPDTVPPQVIPLADLISAQSLPQRIGARVALGVGAVELLLAAAGLYGLLLFVLTSQTRELGIRLALGARASQAGWAVLRAGLRYALMGAALAILFGVVGLEAAVRLQPGVFESGPEPFLVATSAVLLAVAAASLVPAWRAARVRPAAALREE
jgi:predicted permease